MSMVTVTYGDVPVVIEANYFVPGTHRECVIVGERGSLVADYGGGTVTLYAGEHVRKGAAWEAVDRGKEELPVGREEPLRLELAAFLEACRAGAQVPVDARAGLHAVEVVEAAARAAREGRTIPLAEIRSA
jgi:predicted dehydrogenase